MREILCGVTEATEFSQALFHRVTEHIFADDVHVFEDKADEQFAAHCSPGSITILNRMTGFDWRDIETGYRAPDGKFWLASGNFDIREMNCQTFGEAIACIKANANTCMGE